MSFKLIRLFSNDRFIFSKLLYKSSSISMSTSIETNQKYKVFVTQPIPDEAVELLNSNKSIDLVINDQTPLPREKLLNSVVGCDGLFCTLNEKIDNELLDKTGNKLKVIATCSVGYDHIDLKECKSRNIPVGYTPGVLTDATAEFTVGLLLNTSRRISEAIRAAKNGEWASWRIKWMCGTGLSGSTIGIFGLGRIGLAVAHRLQSFGPMRILYHNRKPNEHATSQYQFVDLDTLLKESDFVICTCAATKETENIFNAKLFQKMKSSAIFVNVSRGNVVNQDDLYIALKNNQITAAGLDVTTPEPLPTDHKLFELENCFITPHICSAEKSTRTKMATITATNILNGLVNKPLLHEIKNV